VTISHLWVKREYKKESFCPNCDKHDETLRETFTSLLITQEIITIQWQYFFRTLYKIKVIMLARDKNFVSLNGKKQGRPQSWEPYFPNPT